MGLPIRGGQNIAAVQDRLQLETFVFAQVVRAASEPTGDLRTVGGPGIGGGALRAVRKGCR